VEHNADITKRAVERADAIAWSPVADGAAVKVLERAAGGRLTALVRLEPGAAFELEGAEGCRDALVLAGGVEDARGHHGAGTFLHHPVRGGWRCRSGPGALLLVKRRPSSDDTPIAIDVSAIPWEAAPTRGLWLRELHMDADARVVMLRFDRGTVIEPHRHDRGEELFVLEGELADEQDSYPAHTWVRQPAGSVHRAVSARGCVLFTVAHHLAPPPASAAP
jgi:anti-sigma factor ChrR (cupin superfamily)